MNHGVTENKGVNSIIVRFFGFIPKNGVVLDFGCGFGANSVFLAKKGFIVESVDKSKDRINFLKSEASKQHLSNKIKIVNQDITSFRPNRNFSSVVCTDVLHFLDKKNRDLALYKIKRHTVLGGLNIIRVFTKNGDLNSPRLHFFENGELRENYKDWDILFYEEKLKMTREKDSFGRPKKHEVAGIVAKKT